MDIKKAPFKVMVIKLLQKDKGLIRASTHDELPFVTVFAELMCLCFF